MLTRTPQSVAIIGLGYVGVPLAVLAAVKGHQVIGIDLDDNKLAKIKKGVSPITDEFVEERLKPGLFEVTNDFRKIKAVGVVIVCVPTPVKNDYLPDLEPLKKAVIAVAKNLQRGALVIVESTINPGVSDEVVLPLLEAESGLKGGEDFYLAHCPERINPGDPKWTVQNIPRVLGSLEKEGLKIALSFYRSIIDGDIRPMATLKEAEACKVVENAFRDINIAFVNELAMSFSRLGINVMNVINGAATKPFSFMPHFPGIGVGGHCIPVDPYYLIEYAKQKGFNHDFLLLAREINNQMPEFTLSRLLDGLNEAGLALSRSKIAVLGLSYKPNVGDDRESPSYKFLKLLDEKKAKYDTYDPYFIGKSTKKNIRDVLRRKDAVVIATAHKEFAELIPADLEKTGIKVVIDGRNCLNSDTFNKSRLVYYGVGI